MATHPMPFLIINYGSEMLFILEQRLHAQNIKDEKAKRVIHDVTNSMFSAQFLQELVKPQEIYSTKATREIFDRIAQSSIMKLSSSSMDKLYELMTMACKYQYTNARFPREMVSVTLTHIESIIRILNDTADIDHLHITHSQVEKLSRSLTNGQLADVRHVLLNFFQGRNVKVSLFLQEKMQNNDTTINIPRGGPNPLEPKVLPLGTIRYFDNGNVVHEEVAPHPDAQIAVPFPGATHKWNIYDPQQRHCDMGINLYMIDRKGKTLNAPGGGADANVGKPGGPTFYSPSGSPTLSGSQRMNRSGLSGSPRVSSFRRRSNIGHSSSMSTSFGGAENAALNSLSNLIVSQAPRDAPRINLFDDDEPDTAAASGGGGGVQEVRIVQISRITREDSEQTNSELMKVANDFGAPDPGQQHQQQQHAGDDLLDLMDQM